METLILKYFNQGESVEDIADRLPVTAFYVRKVLKENHYHEKGAERGVERTYKDFIYYEDLEEGDKEDGTIGHTIGTGDSSRAQANAIASQLIKTLYIKNDKRCGRKETPSRVC